MSSPSSPPRKKKLRRYVPGQPRYECDEPECMSSFTRLEHLKRHQTIHRSVLPYQCDVCMRSFSRKDILQRHVKRQHSEPGSGGSAEDQSRSHATSDTRQHSLSESPAESLDALDTLADSSQNQLHTAVPVQNVQAQLQTAPVPVQNVQPSNIPTHGIQSDQGLPAQVQNLRQGLIASGIANISGVPRTDQAGFAISEASPDFGTAPPVGPFSGSPQKLEYLSPGFSDNTHESPEAVLGNTNQAVSHLLNEDFMTWLLTRDASPSLQGAQGELGFELGSPFPPDTQQAGAAYQRHVPTSTQFQPAPRVGAQNSIHNGSHVPPTGQNGGPHTIPPEMPVVADDPGLSLEDIYNFELPEYDGEKMAAPPILSEQDQQILTDSFKGNAIVNVIQPHDDLDNPANPQQCSVATCQRIREALGIPANDPLVLKFIHPQYITYAVDVYWSVHNRWPILHKPSFQINNAPAPLLVSMITLAMYLTQDDDAISLSTRVHETFRYSVYMLPEFRAPTTAIWVFQTLLLAEIFEMMISTEEQHDMATRFYQVLVASMRKGGTMGGFDDNLDESNGSLTPNGRLTGEEAEWRKFITHEGKKRIAFFAFVLDTQHCAFFNQPPSVFISDLPFRLPCEEAVWEAVDAKAWAQKRHMFPPGPFFTPTISSFLRLENNSYQLSPWNMMIILHGLVSVGWNTRLRESIVTGSGGAGPSGLQSGVQSGLQPSNNGKLGSSSSSTQLASSASDSGRHHTNWVRIISESYAGWFRCYRIAFIISGRLPFNHAYVFGCLTTYEFAHVILNADIQRSQQLISLLASIASSSSSSGTLTPRLRAYGRGRAESTFNILNQWTQSPSAVEAVTHALDLIDMFSVIDGKYDVAKDTAFHRPWCLYIASIVVWVYQYFTNLAQHHQNSALLSRKLQPIPVTPASLSQYLGRVRAGIAKRSLDTESASDDNSGARSRSLQETFVPLIEPGLPLRLMSDRRHVAACEANVLLHRVHEMLGPSRWGVMRGRLRMVGDLLGLRDH